MKRIILSAALAVAGFGMFSSFAQSAASTTATEKTVATKERSHRTRGRDFSGITLTAEQQTKVDDLNKDFHAKQKKQRAAAAKTREKERQEYEKKLGSILTP